MSASPESPEILLQAPLSAGAVARNVAALLPSIAQGAATAGVAGRIPIPLVHKLIRSGVFRLQLSPERGGVALDFDAQLGLLESIASVDAGTAWVAARGGSAGWILQHFAPDVAADLFPHVDMILSGRLAAAGTGKPVGDAWLIEGRWPAAALFDEADMLALGFVETGDKAGRIRVALVPPGHFQATPTSGLGLRGAALSSLTPASRNLVVPASHTFVLRPDPAAATEMTRELFARLRFERLKTAAIGLGIACGAIEAVRSHTERGAPVAEPDLVGSADAGRLLAECEMYCAVCRAWLDQAVTRHADPDESSDGSLVAVQAVRTAVLVTRLLIDVASSCERARRALWDAQTLALCFVDEAAAFAGQANQAMRDL